MAWVRRLNGVSCQHHWWFHGILHIAFGQRRCFAAQQSWFVSSFGRCRTSRGQLTTGTRTAAGYRAVTIRGHRFYLHRVVAFAFVGHPPDPSTWQVHHVDGDKSNNRVDNLKYVTHSENNKSSYTDNPCRGNGGSTVSVPVMGRNLQGPNVWRTWPSITAAAKQLGVSCPTVSLACRHGSRVGAYEMKFAPPKEPELLPGEKWTQMKNPTTGNDVPGRQVSSCGRIKSSNGLISRGHQRKSGYVMAEIFDKSRRYSILVHRLVAYAFLGPPPSLQHSQVNHRDFNPGNNCIDNLEYVTPSKNMQHFHASRTKSNLGARRPVLSRLHGSDDEWLTYPSMLHAAKVLGLGCGQVSRSARGLVKQVGSHEFRLDEPPELVGEKWQVVDLEGLLRERASRIK